MARNVDCRVIGANTFLGEDEAREDKPEDRHRFLGHAAFLLSIISFIGVVFVSLPLLFIGGCR